MLLKVIKEIKYDYNKILKTGEIVELIKEYDYYYLVKTEDNIKIKIIKDKLIKLY